MKQKHELDKILETLDIEFKDRALREMAFVHRSFLNESKKYTSSNERLEFLGDSILSLLVSDYLYRTYPEFPEGELTNLRSAIVKTSSLADIAKKINLGELLHLSHGEEESGGRNNPSILADTFEALLGALFLDQGLPAVKEIIYAYLIPALPKILAEKAYRDAKSDFQEVVQDTTKISPVYKVLGEKGPDHAKEFTVGVFVGETLWGVGIGKSKQDGEMKAAKVALEKWNKK